MSSLRSRPPTDVAAAGLADLHDRGKLTDDEFAAQKARLLDTNPFRAGVGDPCT